MQEVNCIRHRHYKGDAPPELSCKSCCHIFLTEVKRKNKAGVFFDYKNWHGERRQVKSLKSLNKIFVDRRKK